MLFIFAASAFLIKNHLKNTFPTSLRALRLCGKQENFPQRRKARKGKTEASSAELVSLRELLVQKKKGET